HHPQDLHSFPTRRSSDLLARAGRGEDRLHTRLDEWLGAHHVDLDLLVEFHDERGTSILLVPLVLAAVAADSAQRDAGDPGPEQRDRKSTLLNSSHDQISY